MPDRCAEVGIHIGNRLAQVAQGKDTQRRLPLVDNHDAADLLLMHQLHGVAHRRFRAAHHRMAHGKFTQSGVQRVLRAEGFDGALLDLLIDLIEQAADTAQGKVAKGCGECEQFDECLLVQLQAEGVLGSQMLGASGTLAEQGGERKTLARGYFKCRFRAAFGRMRTLADDAPLLDDVKVLHRSVARLDDAFTACVEPQLTLLDQIRQMSVFHLIEWREFLQKLHGAVYVLQHGCLACLGESICLAHGLFRVLVIGAHGRPLAVRCPLDVSLTLNPVTPPCVLRHN